MSRFPITQLIHCTVRLFCTDTLYTCIFTALASLYMIPHVVGEYRRYGSVKNYIQYDTVKFNHILHTKLGMSVHIDHTFAGTCFKGRFQNHPEGGGFDFLGGRGWTICNNLTEKGTILSNDISLPPPPPKIVQQLL